MLESTIRSMQDKRLDCLSKACAMVEAVEPISFSIVCIQSLLPVAQHICALNGRTPPYNGNFMSIDLMTCLCEDKNTLQENVSTIGSYVLSHAAQSVLQRSASSARGKAGTGAGTKSDIIVL